MRTMSHARPPPPTKIEVSFNNLPAGYTAQITSVTYWNAPSAFSFGSSCAAGSTSPQLITMSVASASGGASSTINAVVSDPAARPIPTAGSASQLVFFEQPGNGVSGSPFRPQPVVAVEDAAGNVVSSDLSDVTLTLNTVSGPAGATLSSTCTGSEFFGIVTFSNCSILKAGTYTLTATDTSLPGFSITSSTFTVSVGPPSQLVFTTQPNNSTGGVAFPTQPVVTVEDVGGNVVTNDSSTVTLAITSGTGTAGATLSGCAGTEANGAVTFTGCAINKAGSGYTLTATDGSLTPATSAALTVSRGPATQLGFTTSPGASTTGNALTPQPVVTVEDAGGNPATTNPNASITLAIGTQPGTGATLACTGSTTKTATGGVATFAGCKITVATAGSFTLNATAPSLLPGKSAAFTVAGAASKLVFTASPSNSAGGVTFATQPTVTVEDSLGNVVTADTSTVTLAIATQPGSGASLICNPNTNRQTVAGGVATFAGCKITLGSGTPGTYSLGATDGSLLPSTSSTFTVSGPPTHLVFTQQPSGSTGGVAFGTQPIVTVEDAGGNTVTSDTSTVNLAIAAGTGTAGATLSGCSGTETLGVVTFTGCSINTAGTGYALRATDGTLTATTSTPFSITVGAAAQLAFGTQPGGGANGATWGTQPTVSVEDSGGNVVTTATNPVTLGIASQPGSGATLACSANPQTPAGGVATFAGCQITGKAGTYTLSASATGLSGATSNSFNLSVGAATQLAFSTQPGGGANGATWGTQPAVSVEDSGGNVVSTNNTASITLAIGHPARGRRHPRLHGQPQDRGRRRGHLRRVQDHRQGGQLHPERQRHRAQRRHQQLVQPHRRPGQPAGLQHPARRRGQRRHLEHPARRQHRGCIGQRHQRWLEHHLGHRQPARQRGQPHLLVEPPGRQCRRGHLHRLPDHRQGG